MKWSRYNDLFQSQRNGWLLFNSASRNFLKIEDGELALIQKIAQDPEHADYSSSPMLYMQLRSMGFIVEDSADDDLCNIIRMRALTELYAPGNLLLTIAVTRACNFDCSYCFEGNRTGKPMSAEAGISLSEREFHCKGSFKMLHKGRPNAEDLKAVRAFAKDIVA